METLSVNTTICVIIYLDFKSLYALSRTAHRFQHFWSDPIVWRLIVTRPRRPQLTLNVDPRFSTESLVASCSVLWSPQALAQPQAFVRSVCRNLHRLEVLQLRGVEESSRMRNQGIANTLSRTENLRWVSARTRNRTGTEYLRYETSLSMICWVGVRLYRDFTGTGALFPPHQYRVKVGLDATRWDYESEEVIAETTESVQHLVLLPQVVIGRVVQVEFVEKVEKSQFDSHYYLAVERVTCGGFPICEREARFAIDEEALAEELTAANCSQWIERYASRPAFIHRTHLEALNSLGQLDAYLAYRQNLHGIHLTKLESCFLAEHMHSSQLTPQLHSKFTISEELGDILYARGKLTMAYRVYSTLLIMRKTVKCLLTLKSFSQCLTLIDTTEGYGMPTLKDLGDMAMEMGQEVAAEFHAYLNR